jgi:hypothetical protein
MGVRMTGGILITAQHSQCFLHYEKRGKANENSEPININEKFELDRKQGIPDEDIPFLVNHDEVDARILMFAHKGVWDEMKEDI